MSGALKRFALIGDPVAHSLSGRMQQAAFDAAGIAAAYEVRRVGRDELASAIERLKREGYAGWNVTTPHKENIIPLLDACTPEAQGARSVNSVRDEGGGRYVGHDTDGVGFIHAVREVWGFDVAGRSVVLLGSGPASRAVARALRQAGVSELRCWSRNPQTSAAIAPLPDGVADLAVCLLPPGSAVPQNILSCIGRATRVFDANYASRRATIPPGVGGFHSDGLPLLLHQGALAFEWWTGRDAPLDAMRTALGLAPLMPARRNDR